MLPLAAPLTITPILRPPMRKRYDLPDVNAGGTDIGHTIEPRASSDCDRDCCRRPDRVGDLAAVDATGAATGRSDGRRCHYRIAGTAGGNLVAVVAVAGTAGCGAFAEDPRPERAH